MTEETSKKKFYQKWWFWLIIAIVLLAVIGSAIGGGANDGNTDNGSPDEDNAATDVEDQTPQKYYVGDTVSSGNMYVKINSVTETKKIGYSYETEYVFLIVNLRVENRNRSEAYYDSSNFILKNGSISYEPNTAGLAVENGFWLNLTVGAGISKEINIVYEIPASYTTADYYLEIDEGLFSAAEKIYLNK